MKAVTVLLVVLAALLAAPCLRRLRGPLGPTALIRLHARADIGRRLPWLAGPLVRLLGRLDPRSAPALPRLLVELEASLLAGALAGVLVGSLSGAFAGGAAAAAGRVAWLTRRASRREMAVLRDLPLVLDLLALAVEGGLPIGAALELTARRGPEGPLRDAMALAVAAVAAGRPRSDALADLSQALPLPAVAAFVGAITQADRLGGRLAPALRAQAAQRRADRWHRAERRALLAPVRLLLPLALCIFPATFVVLLVPLALRFAAGTMP